MSKVEIELNSDGVVELLKSKAIAERLTEVAEEVAKRAGDGFDVLPVTVGKKRSNVKVHAGTQEALSNCFESNSLVKAVGGRIE